MRRLSTWVLAGVLLACGCPENGASSAQGDESSTNDESSTKENAEPKQADKPVKPKPPPRPEKSKDVPIDQMSRAQLERACFEGRRAACDRLGH